MDYTPPHWPPPPITYYLLENPWPLAVILGAMVAALLLAGQRTRQPRTRIVAAVVGVLALLVVAAAQLVTTDREKMAAGTRALVNAAVQPVDLDVFRNTLGKDVKLFDRDYDTLLGSIERGLDRWQVREAHVTSLKPDQLDATTGKTYLAVLTRIDTNLGGGSTITRWVLHWKKEADGEWRVVRIEWLSLNNETARSSDLP